MVSSASRALNFGKMPWHHAAIRRNNAAMRKVLLPHVEKKLQAQGCSGSSNGIKSSANQKKKTILDLAMKYVATNTDNAHKSSQSKPDAEFIQRVIANLKAFIFAGHDTTSATICFMVKLLQDHPSCLEKLRAEHDFVLGPDTEQVTGILTASPHVLNALPYTLGVIKETLRLHPLAATVRDGDSVPGYALTVPGSPMRYPTAGFGPWLSALRIQRHPDYWPRPDEFLPERWLAVEGEPLYVAVKEAWMPFSLGPRNCVGIELAMIELKLVAVLIARDFDIEEAWDEWDRKM